MGLISRPSSVGSSETPDLRGLPLKCAQILLSTWDICLCLPSRKLSAHYIGPFPILRKIMTSPINSTFQCTTISLPLSMSPFQILTLTFFSLHPQNPRSSSPQDWRRAKHPSPVCLPLFIGIKIAQSYLCNLFPCCDTNGICFVTVWVIKKIYTAVWQLFPYFLMHLMGCDHSQSSSLGLSSV